MPSLTWSSIFGSSFKYDRLETPHSHIRLLELIPSNETLANTPDSRVIECKISTFPLDDAPEYEALSYAWGNHAQDRLPIRLLQPPTAKARYMELRVTRNVFAALTRLRLPSRPRLLWIDQICIDQSTTEDSLDEKNWQIKRMKDIYQSAKTTLIWLGDDDTDTPLIADMLHRLPHVPAASLSDTVYLQRCDQEILYGLVDVKTCKDGLARNRRDALVSFLDRMWFGRAWVYQEAVVSTNLEVILGGYYFSFDLLVRLVYSTYSLVKEDADKTSRALKMSKGYGTLRAMWDHRQQFGKIELDLLNILWCARKYLQASDPRDMVYSFLGIQNLDYPVKADYSKKVTMANAFTTLACNMIRSTHDLSILQCVVPVRDASRREGIPSWVPDWSRRPFLSGAPILAPGLQCLFKASLSSTYSSTENATYYNELRVEAHILDCITKALPHECENIGSEFLKPALKLDSLVALLESVSWYTPRGGSQRLREMALRTLLVDGAFSLTQPVDVEHSISELLRIYDADQPRKGPESDRLIHRFIQRTAAVAARKKVFITQGKDLGLGYCNIEEGDKIALLHGCNTPVILRPSEKHPRSSRHFQFIGQCYVDGWMYGDKLKGMEGWELVAETFLLV